MKTYSIAGTDLQASRIGYGCMHLSKAWDTTPLTAEERMHTRQLVETALEQGITLFDHADIYSRGKSERLFGELLAEAPELRARMLLQSKCGIRFANDPVPGLPGRYDFSHAHITASVEGSLQRLHTDYLDLLLLHRPDALCEPEEVARAFDDLQRSGKVRHFGVSNHSAAQIALLRKHVDPPLVVNQLELSLYHHHLINEGVTVNAAGSMHTASSGTLEYCHQHDIRVQAWSPLANGRLTGAMEATAQTRPVIDCLRELASAYQCSAEAILLAWLLRHPAGIQPIVGTTQASRLRDCCVADDIALSREDWYRLFSAARGTAVP